MYVSFSRRPGMYSTDYTLWGLTIRSYRSVMDEIKSTGFNAIRIPFSQQMLWNSSWPAMIVYSLNPDLLGLRPIECLDKFIDYAGLIGLRIVLDFHMSYASHPGRNTLW